MLRTAQEVLFHRKIGGSSHQLTIIAAPFLSHKTKGRLEIAEIIDAGL
jgi:hypothetical protein